MSNQFQTIHAAAAVLATADERRPIGQILLQKKVLSKSQLSRAVALQKSLRLPLGDVCVAEGLASRSQILEALSEQRGLLQVDLSRQLPDQRLLALRPARFWLRHRAVPRVQLGRQLMIATARPENLDALQADLAGCADHLLPALADEQQVLAYVARHCEEELASGASTRVSAAHSCRTLLAPVRRSAWLAAAMALALLFFAAPAAVFTAFSVAAVLSLLFFLGLRAAGFLAFLFLPTAPLTRDDSSPPEPIRLPRISVMVPLYREQDIASKLIRRLSCLTYPPSLLDVLLVLEEHDAVTRQTIESCELPDWMRVVEVPAHGGLTTKPRALNYALDFCKGDIIGVWDAEDAPAPCQLERVARRFHQAGPGVACLQGILDYYNPRANWLSRCFTIEYASWFRIVMPGLERLGLVLPLGGTTMFIRRGALERLGGWDAHNVTEDADLGVRISRAKLQTQMLNTTTYEEANCRPWPWVRQRSRWLKGFMVTYLVHMRSPMQLMRDLGLWRFLGFNAFFLGTLGHFLLAPFLWSFWLMFFGLPHPSTDLLPLPLLRGAALAMLLFEALSAATGAAAAITSGRRWLIPWVPLMPLYYPMGVLAAYKALYELIWRPFFWDKTSHGKSTPEDL